MNITYLNKVVFFTKLFSFNLTATSIRRPYRRMGYFWFFFPTNKYEFRRIRITSNFCYRRTSTHELCIMWRVYFKFYDFPFIRRTIFILHSHLRKFVLLHGLVCSMSNFGLFWQMAMHRWSVRFQSNSSPKNSCQLLTI